MIKNYFKTAFRNLLRNRKYAMLNILGLGVALAACIIVFLVIQYETSYDKHLAGYKSIYQVVTKDVDGDGEHFSGGVPFPAIKFLRQDFPQYKFAELMQESGVQVTVNNNKVNTTNNKFLEESGVFYGDPELLNIFELKFLLGNADALKDVNSATISKSQAEKYFGNWNEAVGKTINIDNSEHGFQIAAIFEDVPANSDFPFKLVASYEGFKSNDKTWPFDDWGSNTSNHQVYVYLPKGINTAAIDQQLALFNKKYHKENPQTTRTHFLNPIEKTHFDDRFETNGSHVTSKISLYTLAFIGLLIILMACINFVNLSTALAVTRSREVGIRKVMGSSRAQLRMQVFMETSAVVISATALAVLLAYFALPFIKNIMVVQDKLSIFNTGSFLFILGITLVTIILSALYPAFIMGRFKPVEAIKNKINTSKVGSVSLRRVLVVLQFAFSQIFIIATIIAISQMSFIRKSDLGFNKDALLIVNMNFDSLSRSRHDAFRDALMARSDIKNVSFAFDAPSTQNTWDGNFAFDKMEDRDFNVQLKLADYNYINTYGLQLIAGRFYGQSDTCREYVVNETLLKKCGVTNPQDAIGKMFRLGGRKPMPVVGVVKDFKQGSLRDVIQPIALSPQKRFYRTAGIKLSSANLAKANDEIKIIWDKYFPEYVYNSVFLDDNITRFYETEQRLSNMYKVYALLAIFISCLGLYGLISFMVVQKTKEVGIRKVLGASVQSIMYLFSREFTILITIAFVLAAPVAWYLMNTWLKDFVYRIDIGAGVFVIAMAASILIAWITVGYKALRAATVNPVRSLRSE
ncbi:MAG: FtsX-like permease family protein [Bacteroidetes bacterium]|nr:MAG: FtsX-like permease family protein [Bacteroidota bacterium]